MIDVPVYAKITECKKYAEKIHQSWKTVQYHLNEATASSIDLTGLKGDLKSAFIACNANVVSNQNDAVNENGTFDVDVSIHWEGTAVVESGLLARGQMSNSTDPNCYAANSAGVGLPVFNVSGLLVMDSGNSYTLNYHEPGGYSDSSAHDAMLYITYAPEGI